MSNVSSTEGGGKEKGSTTG